MVDIALWTVKAMILFRLSWPPCWKSSFWPNRRVTKQENLQASGIFNFNGLLTLANSTLSGNSAVTSGAGIDNPGGVTLTNVTLLANHSGGHLCSA